MRIDSSGNLALGNTTAFGTTSNRTCLSVNGTTDVSLNIGTGGAQRAFLYSNGSYARLATASSIPLQLGSNDTADVVILDNGNVGIGETSPNDTLHVQGDVKIVSGVQKTPLFEVSSFIGGHTGDVAYIHCATPSSTGYNLLHVQGDSDDTPIEALVVRGDGNVGIGTTDPADRLTVSGGSINIQVPAGSLKLNEGTTDAWAIESNGANGYFRIRDAYNGSDRIRIDSNGNVGLSTTNPTMKLTIAHADQDGLRFTCADGLETFIDFGDASDNDIGRISYDHADNHMAFRTNNSERARITSGGEVQIGTNGFSSGNPTYKGKVRMPKASEFEGNIEFVTTDFSNGYGWSIGSHDQGSGVIDLNIYSRSNSATFSKVALVEANGTIKNGTGTYGTISSDVRLKENISDATPKLSDILSLKVKNFNYLGDEHKQIGFIAQEFEQVFPSLVTERDTRKYDDESNVLSGYENTKGLKVGMEFAILVKAIQEQQDIINELKAEIDELKKEI